MVDLLFQVLGLRGQHFVLEILKWVCVIAGLHVARQEDLGNVPLFLGIDRLTR